MRQALDLSCHSAIEFLLVLWREEKNSLCICNPCVPPEVSAVEITGDTDTPSGSSFFVVAVPELGHRQSCFSYLFVY